MGPFITEESIKRSPWYFKTAIYLFVFLYSALVICFIAVASLGRSIKIIFSRR